MGRSRFNTAPKYRHFDIHLWSDFVELLTLWNIDNYYTSADLTDRIRPEETDISIGLDDGSQEDYAGSYQDDPEVVDDKYEIRVSEYFEHCNFRKNIFGENYPFEPAYNVLKLKNDLNDCHLLYIYLLFCSHLNFFKNEEKIFTSDFEQLSAEAMKFLLPDSAIVHNVGKNSAGGINHYRGNLYSKLESMAVDLGEKLTVSQSDMPKYSSGDGGLDILGWIPFSDKLKSKLIYVAQCKCSEEWKDIRSPKERLKSYMTINHAPNNLFFIPFFFRRSSGEWHEKDKIDDKVLIDRLRIIELFRPDVSLFLKTDSHKTVKSLIEEKESII
jgi:hypothetical protein